jgi:Tubuliform egg casing silk strands structural domain
VCNLVGQPDLQDKVREAVRAHQKGAAAEAYAVALAAIFERVLSGMHVSDAVAAASTVAPESTRASLVKAQAHAHASQNDVDKVCSRWCSRIEDCYASLTTC